MTRKVAQHTQCDITGLSEHIKYRKCTESLRVLIWSTSPTEKKQLCYQSGYWRARRLLVATFIKKTPDKLTHTQRYKTKCVSVSGALAAVSTQRRLLLWCYACSLINIRRRFDPPQNTWQCDQVSTWLHPWTVCRTQKHSQTTGSISRISARMWTG